jgi:hypothetical protein
VAASYAVRWLDPSGAPVAGKLELRSRTLHLEGWNGHAAASCELPYDDLAAVRVDRGHADCIDGRPTLVLARRSSEAVRLTGVGQTGIVSELAERIAELQRGREMSRVTVVLPLKPGARARADELLAKGPPFDPEAAGLEAHDVFISGDEAVFVFEAPERHALDRLVAEAPVWAAAAAWTEILSGAPRFAEEAYTWRRPEQDESISSAPTPGPGDSDGGDIYPP